MSPALRATVPLTLTACPALSSTRSPVAKSVNTPRRFVTVASGKVPESVGLAAAAAVLASAVHTPAALAAFDYAMGGDHAVLCDAACSESLGETAKKSTDSGLQYQDIKVGRGPNPEAGFQVTINTVGYNLDGVIFDSSLDRGEPIDIRIGVEEGILIPGLDEGIRTMKLGGVRRLYIPGELAFPNGLASAPGRPRIPPSTPVVFDVELVDIPGFDVNLSADGFEAPELVQDDAFDDEFEALLDQY
mmetsp:Transcript_13260/g.48284  ORF Transcript_13260/g.48284 Transcript_13260/m.48284 type:complete len:246 (-) Transcript_13260:390-1127(-)